MMDFKSDRLLAYDKLGCDVQALIEKAIANAAKVTVVSE